MAVAKGKPMGFGSESWTGRHDVSTIFLKFDEIFPKFFLASLAFAFFVILLGFDHIFKQKPKLSTHAPLAITHFVIWPLPWKPSG